MAGTVIDGKAIAAVIRAEIGAETARLKKEHGITPGLVTILVGEDPGSVSYVTAKGKAAKNKAKKVE